MTNILVLCDDQWHPGEVIVRGLGALKTDEYKFDFVMDAKDILTPVFIARYPAIICCKGNYLTSANTNPWFDEITEVKTKEFKEYVSAGGGFLSLHSGNTAKQGDDYAEFSGSYFLGHPPRCEVRIHITGSHPIVNGVKDFTIRDEHYQMALIAKDSTELFCTSSDTGGKDWIGGYTREIGKGRLCVMTPGHVFSVWEHPEYQKLLINALDWCLKKSNTSP